MTNTFIAIFVVILLIVIGFKVFKSIVKGIIFLIIVVALFFLYNNISGGKLTLNTLTNQIQNQVQQQSSQEILDTVLKKVEGMDPKQMEEYLKDAQAELQKHGLTIESVKKAINNSNPLEQSKKQ